MSIAQLEQAAAGLGPLGEKVAFLGGATMVLWITESGAPPLRLTKDVDVIVELGSTAAYYALGEELRERRFEENPEAGQICAWRHLDTGLELDVMPTERSVAAAKATISAAATSATSSFSSTADPKSPTKSRTPLAPFGSTWPGSSSRCAKTFRLRAESQAHSFRTTPAKHALRWCKRGFNRSSIPRRARQSCKRRGPSVRARYAASDALEWAGNSCDSASGHTCPMARRRPLRAGRGLVGRAEGPGKRRPVVLFFDQDAWNPFLQLAAALRRGGARPVCLQLEGGRRRALIARVGYGTVLRASRGRDVRRLERLLDEGRVLDAHVNELNFARLDVSSGCGALLRRAMDPAGNGRWLLLDKLEVSERLEAGGVGVPPRVRLAAGGEPPKDEAVAELGYPLMVKQRISSGGAGVLVAHDRASLAPAISTLTSAAGAGSPAPPVFFERFVRGEIVQYAAVVSSKGIEREACLRAIKGDATPYAPSVSVVTIDDPALRAAGRKAVEVLGCVGLVNLEFIRDADGALWHIDLAMRAYGNMAALTDAGVDMIGAYLRLIGLDEAVEATPVPPLAGRHARVFPTKMLERKHAVGLTRAAWEAAPDAYSYLRAYGVRYLFAIALVVVDGHIRARERR